MTREETKAQEAKYAVIIRDAVFAHYMQHMKPAKPADIATILGWPESKVRRVIRDILHDFVNGATRTQVEVPCFSKNYPSMQSGTVLATAWLPALWFIREKLLEVSK